MNNKQLKPRRKKEWKARMAFLVEILKRKRAGERITDANILRNLKKFRLTDFPFMEQIVNIVKSEKLLEEGKSSVQRMLETKIKRAEQGYYLGSRLFGYMVKNGLLFETKDIEKRKGVLVGLREGKSKAQLAREFGLSVSIVEHALSHPVNKGEYMFMGKPYKITKGNFKPLITPQEWDEIQSMLPPKDSGGPRKLYMWKNGKWVAKPEAKEKVKEVFKLRLEGKSFVNIAKELGLNRWLVRNIIRNRRITGKEIVDGKLVDSGFETLIDTATWEAAQKIHVPSAAELIVEKHKENIKEIMGCMPVYRWEIRAKTGLSVATVCSIIRFLKDGILKEREDGLLERSWKPYPEKVLSTARMNQTRKRKKVLEVVSTGETKTRRLLEKTGLHKDALRATLDKLKRQDIVETRPSPSRGGFYHRIKDEWNGLVKQWLNQPHIASL